uniref:Vomeromodulin-like n=1 Tax=Jaculus jaculus TaxID=51337 RepID=A0A8C5KTT1_JACJA
MRTFWALAFMVAIQGGALDVLNAVPLDVPTQGRKGPSTQQGPEAKKHPASSKGGRCAPAAKYMLSSSKLKEYLMDTLPPQIEELVKCEQLDLAGLLGTVLDTVGESNLLSVLDVKSLLDVGGGLGLDGLLGKGGDDKSLKLPSVSKAAGAVSDTLPEGPEGLGGLLPPGLNKGAIKGLLDGHGLSDLQKPLDDVVGQVGDLKSSAQDVVQKVLPPNIKKDVSEILDLDLKKLLLELKVEEVTMESMEVAMEGDGIQVQAMTSAAIGGGGLAGPVISLVGLQAKLDVTLKIDISSNNTQCVNLEVQETQVQVTEVSIKLVETVTDVVPLPVPLPLDQVVPMVLSIEINEKVEKSNSCAIVLSDFNDCKNSTGLFKYQVKSAQISQKGLSILYCANAVLGGKTVPVPGSRLPPDSKNANISIILSHTMVNTLLNHAAKQSSVTMDNLSANITKVSYAYQKDKPLRATYKVVIQKDGQSFATGKTVTFPHLLQEEEAGGIMSEVSKKLFSNFSKLLKEMNVPTGVSSFPLTNVEVKKLKLNDLQASS